MERRTHHDIAEAVRGVLEGFPRCSEVTLLDDKDADYRVRARVNGVVLEFLLDVKAGFWHQEVLDRIRVKQEKLQIPVVLGMAWIPAKRALALREKGVNYLDTAGNAFLDLPGWLVDVGPRPNNGLPLVDPAPKRSPGSVFNASAVRVGLQLLLNPGLVGANLRRMGAMAGVSAPSAKFALDAFKTDGYVIDAGQMGRRLVDREGFFRKWAESYNQRYRPRHVLGRYSLERNEISIEGLDACWGGEPGADRLTHDLKPAEQVLYSYTKKIGPLIARNRLRPESGGAVELLEACWDKPQEEPEGTAPAFVVFADLVYTRDPRCIEVAERIFETILRERLRVHGE